MDDSVGLESGFWSLCLCHRTVTPLESCMLLWTAVASSVKCVCAGGVGLDYTRGSGAQSMELVTQPSEVLQKIVHIFSWEEGPLLSTDSNQKQQVPKCKQHLDKVISKVSSSFNILRCYNFSGKESMTVKFIRLSLWPPSSYVLSNLFSNSFLGAVTPRAMESCNTLSGRLGGMRSHDWHGSLREQWPRGPGEPQQQYARSCRRSAAEAGANYHPLDEQDMHFLGVGKNFWLDKLKILWPT